MESTKVNELIAMAAERFGEKDALYILLYAAAAQTLHMNPTNAAKLFEDARQELINTGAI